MALTKRIIPCLDIQNGRTVKGVQFQQMRDMGNPVELAARYAREGADELVFLDITASDEKRKTLAALVTEIAKEIDIPFTVGGGISSVDDVYTLLDAGADKVSVNTAAIKNPALITQVANRFGSQCVVVAIDARHERNGWNVYLHGGKTPANITALAWAQQAADMGAGEILLTSVSNDGTGNGFALELTATISKAVSIPVIASGGAGSKEHFAAVLDRGIADAALAAGIFHNGSLPIPELKKYLQSQNIPVRI